MEVAQKERWRWNRKTEGETEVGGRRSGGSRVGQFPSVCVF